MKKLILLSLIVLITISSTYAQSNPNELTYDSIKSFYKNYIIQLNDSSYDGASTKYFRFESMMDYKFNKNSTIGDYVSKVQSFNNQIANNTVSNTQSSSFLQSNWHNIVNEKMDRSANGRFTAVWVNPNPPYNILAGTPSSGIWKTTNGQTNPNWENLTSFKLKNCGISQIAVSPLDTNIIYASTSFSGSYVSWYGMGLIYSTNGGLTWNVDNTIPSDFFNVTNWQWKTKLPIAFKPGTNELLIGYENRVWRKNCTPGFESWTQQPVYSFSIPNLQAFMIYDIKFSNSNPNLVVCSANNGSEKEIVYSFSGGNTGTWNEFVFNSPAIFDDANLIYNEFHNSVFIDEDNGNVYLLIGVGNKVSTSNSILNRTYLVRFKKKLNQNIFEEDKIWSASEGSTTFLGATNGMQIVKNVGGSYYLIIGQGTSTVFTSSFTEDNSVPFQFSAKSNYWPSSGNKQTHADVRDLKYINGKIYIATDGGISVSENLCSNANDWTSLNGTSLNAQEILGFDNTELDKDYIVCSAMDGNSFSRINSNGIINYSHHESGDRFDAAISKLQKHEYGNVMSINSGGPNSPSLLRSSNASQFDPPRASGGENYALKQFDLEDQTNNFYVGTTDVQKFDDFFNRSGYSIASNWSPVSRSNVNAVGRDMSFPTDGPITAFKSVKHPTANKKIVSIYSIKGAVNLGTTPPKLIYVEYDYSNVLSPVFSHVNITPYTVDNVTSNENSLYKNWIQDIIIDEKNPNRVWVCFGGTSQYIHDVSGRIYHTENASSPNPIWTDVSDGLPSLPILSLVYWKGTDDIIFAGTDVGVYVYNKNLNSWEMFMNNFPYITVPELDINYCSGTLRACTSGMGIWETPLPNIAFENELPIEVTSNQTWNASRDTYQSILVKSGATLTIEGVHNTTTNTNSVEIRIPKDKQIMVEPGGKLIIDGATITNHCDLWQGIEVYGQKTELQTGEVQGWVVIKNGSIIENARTGVTTSKVYDWGWDPNSTGGIVHCYNSTFRNNRRDIELLSYHRTTTKKTAELANRAVFSKCLFITDNNYLFGTSKPVHLTMWDVNGASIIGSTFEDARTVPSESIGIYTISSGFNVNEYCVGSTQVPVSSSPACSGIQSKFKNLEYGIYAMNVSNPRYSVNVSNSLFDKCSRAIYLNGVNYSSVFLNNFNVKKHEEMVTNEYNMNRYGVYLDLCKSYKVEENSFIGDVDVETETESFGVVVRNMHGENTQVYKNYFNLLSVGIEAIAQNRSRELDKGLQIKCNDFNESKYDIVVVNDPEVPSPTDVAGIGRTQGYPNSNFPGQLAGNLFGNSSNYLLDNFVNQCGFLEYFHHEPGTEPRVEPSRYRSQSRISLIAEGDEYVSSTACPTSFTNVFNASQLRTSVITAGAHLQENIEALAAMVDAGNSEDFLTQLDFYDVGSVNSNYFLLMNTAPYLSINVLKLVVEDGTVFSNAMIRNILVACSQSAKDAEIQSRLDHRSNPLPQYMREQIDLGLVEMSSMEEDERQIGTYKLMIDNSVSETMWRATQDTLDLSENIFEIFNEVEDYMFKLQLVDWIDADNRKDDANNLLAEIGNNIESENLESYNIYRDMRDFCYFLQDENLEADRLDGGFLDFLSSYLSIPNSNISYAMALLKLNNQLTYIEPLMIPNENSDRVVNISPDKIITELDPSESSLEVSPNPASDLIVAKYKILEKSNNLQLVITDINGRELYSQNLINQIDEIVLNCSAYISGNYFITIKGDGIKSLNQKIIVSRK